MKKEKSSNGGTAALLTALLLVAMVVEVGLFSFVGVNLQNNRQAYEQRAAEYEAYQEQQEQARNNPSNVQYAGPQVRVVDNTLVEGEWEPTPPERVQKRTYTPLPVPEIELASIEVAPVASGREIVPDIQIEPYAGGELEDVEITPSKSSEIDSYSYSTNQPSSGTGGNANNFNTYNNTNQQNTEDKYVLNSNTKKFHIPSCRDVPKIAEKNYSTSNDDRNDIIASGYSPCKHCNP